MQFLVRLEASWNPEHRSMLSFMIGALFTEIQASKVFLDYGTSHHPEYLSMEVAYFHCFIHWTKTSSSVLYSGCGHFPLSWFWKKTSAVLNYGESPIPWYKSTEEYKVLDIIIRKMSWSSDKDYGSFHLPVFYTMENAKKIASIFHVFYAFCKFTRCFVSIEFCQQKMSTVLKSGTFHLQKY